MKEQTVERWAQERPIWCPHSTCGFQMRTQDSGCVGQLPESDPHDGDFNTHRLCRC